MSYEPMEVVMEEELDAEVREINMPPRPTTVPELGQYASELFQCRLAHPMALESYGKFQPIYHRPWRNAVLFPWIPSQEENFEPNRPVDFNQPLQDPGTGLIIQKPVAIRCDGIYSHGLTSSCACVPHFLEWLLEQFNMLMIGEGRAPYVTEEVLDALKTSFSPEFANNGEDRAEAENAEITSEHTPMDLN